MLRLWEDGTVWGCYDFVRELFGVTVTLSQATPFFLTASLPM